MNGAPSFQIDSCPALVFFTLYCPPPRVRNSSIQSSVSMWVCTSMTVMEVSREKEGVARRTRRYTLANEADHRSTVRNEHGPGDQQQRDHREDRDVHVHQARTADVQH